jgi:hypothetical protein
MALPRPRREIAPPTPSSPRTPGPSAVTGATVADTFPAACTSVSYTSVAAGGATGNTAGPASGNINDTALNLPVGASVIYTAICNIAPTATGTLVNTATISGSTTDPTPVNNSATDTDTLVQTARVESIPIFSVWGLGALIGLFGLALARLQRRV